MKLKLSKKQENKIHYLYMMFIGLVPLFCTITIFYFVIFGNLDPFWQGVLTVVGIIVGLIAISWTRLLLMGSHPID